MANPFGVSPMYGPDRPNYGTFGNPFPASTATGEITPYDPQYGKYYAGQKRSDVEGMLGEESRRKGLIAGGADYTGTQNKLSSLMADPSSIQNDPSYKFRFDQGNQLINRSAAAKGMLGSGNVLAELAKYGQGMASEEYGNQFNRLSDLMRQQQAFGLSSGYFDNQRSAVPSDVMQGRNTYGLPQTTPSYW